MIYLFTIAGLLIGSFYTVVADRWSNDQSIIKPRSFCPNCQHQLSWYELIPILSYIFLKGKCKNCQNKISIFHPLMEILTAFTFALSYYLYGFSSDLIIALTLSSLTTIIFVSDFKYTIILDIPLIIGSILILIAKYLENGFTSLSISFLEGIAIFSFLLFIKLLGDKVFKKESLGGGDVKLVFIFGITVGAYLSFVSLIIASLITYPVALYYLSKQKDCEIPFGPFLIASLFITFIFETEILTFLNNLLN